MWGRMAGIMAKKQQSLRIPLRSNPTGESPPVIPQEWIASPGPTLRNRSAASTSTKMISPTTLDFGYPALTIGMTYQVSDTPSRFGGPPSPMRFCRTCSVR